MSPGAAATTAAAARTCKPLRRPIDKFAGALAQCSKESAAYGKCIVADYNNVSKDKCAAEFLKLQQCYVNAYKKKG